MNKHDYNVAMNYFIKKNNQESLPEHLDNNFFCKLNFITSFSHKTGIRFEKSLIDGELTLTVKYKLIPNERDIFGFYYRLEKMILEFLDSAVRTNK